jgi:hypothetical protein
MPRSVRERPRLAAILAGGAVLLLVATGLTGAALDGGDAQARREADRAQLAAGRAEARVRRLAQRREAARGELRRLRQRLAAAEGDVKRWRAGCQTVRRTTTEGRKR